MRNANHIIILWLLIALIGSVLTTGLFAQSTDNEKLMEMAADSVSLERAVRYLKNPALKQKVEQLFNQLMTEKRKINSYPVDFYYSRGSKNNYTPNQSIGLTLEQMTDSILNAVELAKILRINKIDFFRFLMTDSTGAENAAFYSTSQDNYFVELDSFPMYRQKEFLKQIFLETVLSVDKKRSLEFIWGRSEDDDAYYSTKLTAFSGQFSVYPRYRTYVGLDTFRGKKSWFYDLVVYRKPQYLDTLTLSGQHLASNDGNVINNSIVNLTKTDNLMDSVKIDAKLVDSSLVLTTKNSTVLLSKSFNVACYDKKEGADTYQLLYETIINSTVIYDSLKSNLDTALYLKIEKNSTAIQNRLLAVDGDVLSVSKLELHDKLNLILSAIENNPDNRHSVEWITGRSDGGSAYYATVITAFDGQLTVFNNYKKIAERSVIKDKNSWYNKLPVYNPQ